MLLSLERLGPFTWAGMALSCFWVPDPFERLLKTICSVPSQARTQCGQLPGLYGAGKPGIDHLVFFSIGPIVCVCLASLRKWVWVIPFQSLPQLPAPPQPKSHLSLCLHHNVLPCFAHCKSLPLPSDYQFSVTDPKYIFAG